MANNKPRGKHARVETLTNELFEKDTEEEIEESSSEVVEQQEEEQATSSDTTDESGETAEDVHEADETSPAEASDDSSEEGASTQITESDDTSTEHSETDNTIDADETVALDAAGDMAEQATVAIDPIDPSNPFEVPAIGELADGPNLSGLDVPSIELGEDAAPGFVPGFDVPKNKSRKVGKIIGITLGSIVGVLAIAYVAVALVFSNWFLPNTTIGDMDISRQQTPTQSSKPFTRI